MSVTDDILSAVPESQGGASVVDDILSPSISEMPLDSVMTPTAPQTQGASFATEYKTGYVDDPQAQMKIYAATRFPDLPEKERLKRYGIHEGEVVYLGDDGKIRRETPDNWVAELKRMAAKTGAHAPSLILGIIGAATGPWTSAGGAMVGEMIRKDIGHAVFKEEPKEPLEEVWAVGKEGLFDVGGYGAGKLVGYGARKAGLKAGGKLAQKAGRDIRAGKIDMDAAEAVRLRAKKYGIDLLPPQTTESQELLNRFTMLADLPRTADFIQKAKQLQAEQIDNAVYKYLNTIAPKETTAYKTGGKLVEASKKAVQRPVDIRKAKATPMYQKAFASKEKVDVEPVVKWIDKELKMAKAEVRTHLLAAKKALLEPDIPKIKGGKTGLVDASGKEIVKPTVKTYDTSLKGLHASKMALDSKIAKAKKDSLGHTVKRNYQRVKTLLLKQMDQASPDYAKARRIFSEYSEEVEKQTRKTMIGEISKLEGDQVINAARKLYSSTFTSPEAIHKARAAIKRQNPEAWDAALRTFLQDTFEGIKNRTTGETVNLGGWMYKKTFGNPRQRKILRAAMTDKQFHTLTDFMDVLRRSGLIFRKESATATRQIEIAELKRAERSKIAAALDIDVTHPFKRVANWIDDALFGKNQEALAKALLSDDAAQRMRKMKRLSPKSEKLIIELGTFMGLVVGQNVGGGEQERPIPQLKRQAKRK